MTKNIIIFILVTVISTFSYGQDEIKSYKKIYQLADSLKKSGYIKDINSSVFKVAQALDRQHPSKFFEKVSDYLSKEKFNEATFLYYLGLMRFRYYNAVNPDYQPSGDGALLASFKYTFSESLNMYLRTDIDNFISLLKISVTYYDKNDFTFYSKSKNQDKFNEQTKSYLGLITELENNKSKYTDSWDKERISMEKNIDEVLKYQKQTDNNKVKGKKKLKK